MDLCSMMPVLALLLSATPVPDRIAVFIVRDKGIQTPLITFQEKVREQVEAHLFAEIVSMDEMFTRGDLSFQAMVDCRGDPACFAELLRGSVDARLLLLITASKVDESRLVGARLIDLAERKVIGEELAEVAADQEVVDALPDRIRKAVPEGWWDPFGSLSIEVNEAGAELTLDGRVIGLSPIGSLAHLMPGRYAVRAEKEGWPPVESLAIVERGVEAKVRLEMKQEESPSLWWLWTGIAVVVVAGGATALAFALKGDDAPASFCTSTVEGACD